MSTNSSPWLKVFAAFAGVACVVLCVMVLKLTREVNRLQGELVNAARSQAKDGLTIGDVLPSLTALGRDGKPTPDEAHNLLNFTDGRLATVFVALGGACPTCEEHLPEFDRLAADYQDAGIVVAGVQIDTSEASELKSAQKHLPLAFVGGSSKTWLRRIPLVPSVLVFDQRGELRGQFIGTLTPEHRNELNALLAQAMHAWK